jgi:hypothetical protein
VEAAAALIQQGRRTVAFGSCKEAIAIPRMRDAEIDPVPGHPDLRFDENSAA